MDFVCFIRFHDQTTIIIYKLQARQHTTLDTTSGTRLLLTLLGFSRVHSFLFLCAMYIFLCAMYIFLCAMYIFLCAMYIFLCAMYIFLCAMYIFLCAMYIFLGISACVQWTIPQLTKILISTSLDKIPS